MRKIFLIGILLLAFSVSSNAQEKGWGAGIIIGNPTGLSAKLWTGGNNAFQFGLAWSFSGNSSLLLQADYLWHFSGIAVSEGKLPIYAGAGIRLKFNDDLGLGIRIPVGLDYMFANTPLDIFLEVVPVVKLTPSTGFDVDAGVGIRYWF